MFITSCTMDKLLNYGKIALDFLHRGLIITLREIGLTSIDDFMNQILFLKYKVMAGSVLIISLLSSFVIEDDFTLWMETYVYAPKLIFLMCISGTFSEYFTGFLKAKKVDGEKFNLTKGMSILPKVLSQAWALTTAFHFGGNEPLMAWLPSAVAIFLFTFNYLKTAYHLALMGWLPDEFVKFLQEKFSMNHEKDQ